MIHCFDPAIASKYGVNAAILLYNINYWIEKNKANNKHFYDNNYWTYNSKEAFSNLFTYMTARQIDYAIKKLIDDGIIITGNYNKSAYDRTLWYSITEKGYKIIKNNGLDIEKSTEEINEKNDDSNEQNCKMQETTRESSILQNCEMEETKLLNGNDTIVEPIPNINTYNKPDSISKKDTAGQNLISFDEIIDSYSQNEEIRRLLKEWLKIRKLKKLVLTNGVLYENLNIIDKYAKQSNISVVEYLKYVISKGWGTFYPITNNNSNNNNTVRQEIIPEWFKNEPKETEPVDPEEVAKLKEKIRNL